MTATVDYVSLRTVRLRAENGEIFTFSAKHCPGLLPGDQVEGEVGKLQGRKHLKTETLSIKPRRQFQAVLQVEYEKSTYQSVPLLASVGLSLPGVIAPPDKRFELKRNQYVVATLSRNNRTHKHVIWKILSIDRYLLNQCELAAAVAMSRFGVKDNWTVPVLSEIEANAQPGVSMEMNGRRDLRNLSFVTIDPVMAQDHDDAVYCERMDHGKFRLFVAIADVAHYVRPGSTIDAIAGDRGASIYFPCESVPMLPLELSNDICSLKPEVDRLAMICEMVVAANGTVASYEFYEAVIRSRARLTYEAVQDIGWGSNWHPDIVASLHHLHELRDALMKAREARGALTLDIPEASYGFDSEGEVSSVRQAPKFLSHSLIEETMLVTNVCAAQFIAKHYKVAGLYRIHDSPTPLNLSFINQMLNDIGVQSKLTGNSTLDEYQIIFDKLKVRDPSLFSALQLHLLRSFEMAVYSPKKSPHFALNFPEYTHFTSPIRRYPDLIVHRLIKNILNGTGDTHEALNLPLLAQRCSISERRAESCARDAERWLKAAFMRAHIGETFDGVIVDTKKFGVFVQLAMPYVSGMVPVSKLSNEYFHYNETLRNLVGSRSGKRFGIGDCLRVRVTDTDPEFGYIDFELA